MRYLFNPGAVFQFNSFLRFVKTIRIYSIPVCSGCDTVVLTGSPESLSSQPHIWHLQQHYSTPTPACPNFHVTTSWPASCSSTRLIQKTLTVKTTYAKFAALSVGRINLDVLISRITLPLSIPNGRKL